MAELKGFNKKVLELLKKQKEGEALTFPSGYSDGSWISFDIIGLLAYADDKLSSANPKIYLMNLVDLMGEVRMCLSNYCTLINKSENLIAKELYEFENSDFKKQYPNPFYSESKFCIKYKEYYTKKNALFEDTQYKIAGNDANLKFDSDKMTLLSLLQEEIPTLTNDKLDYLCDCILHFSYGNDIPEIQPVMALMITQNKLIELIKRIRKEFRFGPSSREYLADLFAKIPESFSSREPIFYNKRTIQSKL